MKERREEIEKERGNDRKRLNRGERRRRMKERRGGDRKRERK